MSKKAKNASKERRLREKRARKQANKAAYARMRDMGENSKSKRFVKRGKNERLAKRIDHPEGNCGNFGCVKCRIKTK